MDPSRTALFLHVAAGGVSLLSFWTAAVLPKGSERHRRAGDAYLLAMVGVVATGVPLAHSLLERGHPVSAMFLGFLLVLVSQSCWVAWRAIRDRTDPARFYGPVYWLLAGTCAIGGAGIVAVGLDTDTIILQAFGAVGLMAGAGSLRSWRRWRKGHAAPNWWLREHYGAILGGGVATHIAFLGIGLRNALPFIEPQVQQLLAWLGPLATAIVVGAYLDRKHARPARL